MADSTDGLYFRKITKEDIDRVYEIECECFSHPWPRSAFEEIVEKADADYYLAEVEETPGDKLIVGGCVLFHIVDEGDFTNVAVTEAYRGRAIAEQMLNFAMDCGKQNGIKDFTLEVRSRNAAALRLYEKCGFESVGIRPGFYRDPKDDAVVMWKYG